jgi:opacity protein-like surface antigen
MRRFLFVLFGTAAGAAALLCSSAALAATPTQIYRDYADNGRLDAHYSRSDLNRALKDAVLQGYGNENVQPGLQQELQGGAAGVNAGLPFTGLDLTLMVVGGMALLLTGAGLRRMARSRG